MEKVVYLLGAGFSAPLGLPVMSNFLIKSKDMFAEEPKRYGHFGDIFETIKSLSLAKNYYAADLFNIEEILSILVMKEYASGYSPNKKFEQFLADVIQHLTPTPVLPDRIEQEGLPSNFWQSLLGDDQQVYQRAYGYFVASLLNLHVTTGENPFGRLTARVKRGDPPKTSYAVVTLNYDKVLESTLEFIRHSHGGRDQGVHDSLTFTETLLDGDNAQSHSPVYLAKLHGSVEPLNIVPPTWNKTANGKVSGAWKVAHKVLSDANDIRIIGYSLPTSDLYIHYLLKSAVLNSSHLKHIDILCLDSDGSVKNRYDEFIKFRDYRFLDCNTIEYLDWNYKRTVALRGSEASAMAFDKLEEAHSSFVRSKQ